ncbi:MAG TPA: hypothetical protein VL242_17935, partial [Sorangium sp.]|nr:hypothetical protein [Sorangium sp.]
EAARAGAARPARAAMAGPAAPAVASAQRSQTIFLRTLFRLFPFARRYRQRAGQVFEEKILTAEAQRREEEETISPSLLCALCASVVFLLLFSGFLR